MSQAQSQEEGQARSEERFFTSVILFEELASPEQIMELRSRLFEALRSSGYQIRPYDKWANAFLSPDESTPFREEPVLINDCRWEDPGETPHAMGLRIVVRLHARKARELHEVIRQVFTDFFGHRSAADDGEEGLAVYTFGAYL